MDTHRDEKLTIDFAWGYCTPLFTFPFVSTVTSFPGGHFDMSALDHLEVAGISIFNKLAPKFLSLASALHFPVSISDNLTRENNPVEGSRAMMKAWLSGKSPLLPTWQVLLEQLQFIDMGELAQEIEQFFNTEPVISPSASLVPVCHVCMKHHIGWYGMQ